MCGWVELSAYAPGDSPKEIPPVKGRRMGRPDQMTPHPCRPSNLRFSTTGHHGDQQGARQMANPHLVACKTPVCLFVNRPRWVLCASRTARALTLSLRPRDTLHATLSVTPPCPALWRYILHAASCCHGAWAGRLLALRGSTGWRYFSLFFVWVMCMASLSPGQARLTSAHGLL